MELARSFDGKKYMWDGRGYSNEQEMKETKKTYLDKGFEVQVVEEENQYFLFSRRLVKEVVVEGQPQ
jgi:hypothetical protein